MQTLVARLSMLGGILLALVGAFYTIGLLPRLVAAPRHIAVDLLGLLTLGLAPLGFGLWGIWYGRHRLVQARQAAHTRHEATLEQALMHALKSHPDGITAQEGATATACSLSEVETKLSNLYLDGKLDMEVTEQGRLVYKLRALP